MSAQVDERERVPAGRDFGDDDPDLRERGIGQRRLHVALDARRSCREQCRGRHGGALTGRSQDYQRADGCPGELGHPVSDCVTQADPLVEQCSQGHRRVEVRPGDVAHRPDASQQCETEAESDADYLGRAGGPTHGEYPHGSETNQDHGSQKLAEILVDDQSGSSYS